MHKSSNDLPDEFYKKVAAKAYEMLYFEPDMSNEELATRYHFSEEYQAWKKKILTDKAQPKRPAITKKIAIAVAIILILSMLFAMNVGSIRDIFYDWLLSFQSDHAVSVIAPKDEPDMIIDKYGHITTYYQPTYLPYEYQVIYNEDMEVSHRIIYSNGTQTIDFQQYIIDLVDQFDTETHEYHRIDEDDLYAIYFQSDEYTCFMWQKYGYQFIINANLPISEIIKIANSISES